MKRNPPSIPVKNTCKPSKAKSAFVSQTLGCWLIVVTLLGCGTTRSYTATEQLLMSDAVDATVAKINFTPLAGKKVFLDTAYMKMTKAPNVLLDTDYVLSSIRQQMIAAEVHLVDTKDEAELVAEPRLGTMGLDGNSVTYGVPATNMISGAAALAGSPLPSIPEMSIGRREAKMGAAKVAVFAYKRDTREPYWQSGIARSSSTSRDTWFLGIGPWQQGTIYEGTRFAGNRTRYLGLPTEKVAARSPAFEEFRSTKLFAAAIESSVKTDEEKTLTADANAKPAAPASSTPATPQPAATPNATSPAPTQPAPTQPATQPVLTQPATQPNSPTPNASPPLSAPPMVPSLR